MNKVILLLIISFNLLHGMEAQWHIVDQTHKFLQYQPNQLGSFLQTVKDDVDQTARRHPNEGMSLILMANMLGYTDSQTDPQAQKQQLNEFCTFLARYRIAALSLHRNLLEEVPDTLSQLSSLEKLDLSMNCLKTVPKTILELSSLKELNLHHNWLEALPSDISRSSQLTIDLGTQVIDRGYPTKPVFTLQKLPIRFMLNPLIILQCSLYQLGILHRNMEFATEDQRQQYLGRYKQTLIQCLQQHPEFDREDMKIEQ